MTIRDKVGLAVLGILSVPFLAIAGLFGYNAWWFSEAKEIVEESIRAIPAGAEVEGVKLSLRSDSVHVPRRDFSRPVEITEGDSYPTSATLIGFLGPGAWVAQIHVQEGPRYEFEVRRHDGEWYLWIYPLT